MRRLSVALAAGLTMSVVVLASAQSSPLAKKTATIPVPPDGNATVAHVVLQATAKKGKKPRQSVKRPKLKVQKAPAGVVVAASYKRDTKNKNRWHATVAITNPVGAPLRATASTDSGRQEDGEVVLIIETEDAYIIVFGQVEIEEDVTFQEMPVPPWMQMWCDPPGSNGDIFLRGMPTGDILATEFLDDACLLGGDDPVTAEVFQDLGLAGVVGDLDLFPGVQLEYYFRFEGVNVAPFNGIALTAPPGHNVTALLPPPGGYGATRSGTTATFGRADLTFAPGTEYRANIRYDQSFGPNDILKMRLTTDFGQTYSNPFPMRFTP